MDYIASQPAELDLEAAKKLAASQHDDTVASRLREPTVQIIELLQSCHSAHRGKTMALSIACRILGVSATSPNWAALEEIVKRNARLRAGLPDD